MSDVTPSPASGTSVTLSSPSPEPPVRLTRLLLGLAVAVAAFDQCFWNVNGMGFSVAVFFLVLGGIILALRETSCRKPATYLIVALLVGASFAAMLETGFTNTVVLLVLIVVLAGETYYGDIATAWGRWLSQVVSLIFAPGRALWLCATILDAVFSKGLGWTGGIIGGCLLAIPALVLTLIFGSLLATGNAVFGSWTDSFFSWLWKDLALYLNPARIILWAFMAFIMLPLLRPANISAFLWRWTRNVPRLPEIIPSRGALFSSVLTLVVLNLLFLVANFADALFLWSGQALPKGVSYSSYVHNGVNTLTVTVILSALVLTTIFQQALEVTRRRELKFLGMAWIAQNLFLLLSVVIRLKLYIQAYDMTVTRLSVMIFLVLVAAGYALLTIMMLKDRSLSWLMGGCVLAVFVTFYITQFLNLEGWSANYNLEQWEQDNDHGRHLDVDYLFQLGPSAWPALRKAADEGADLSHDYDAEGNELNPVKGAQFLEKNRPETQFTLAHWREFSLRAYMNRWAIDDKK